MQPHDHIPACPACSACTDQDAWRIIANCLAERQLQYDEAIANANYTRANNAYMFSLNMACNITGMNYEHVLSIARRIGFTYMPDDAWGIDQLISRWGGTQRLPWQLMEL